MTGNTEKLRVKVQLCGDLSKKYVTLYAEAAVSSQKESIYEIPRNFFLNNCYYFSFIPLHTYQIIRWAGGF